MENPLQTHDLDAPQRRSIDYMIRNMQDHHVQLSNMADQKAQILLGVCSLIVTFALNQITQNTFSYGLAILSLMMFATMIPAILAITPRLGPKNPEAAAKKEPPRLVNPLFFGSYADLRPEQFLEEMDYLIEDSNRLYKSLFLNIYNNGRVMADKKYRYLTLSYNLFLIGMVVGTLATIVEFLLI